MLEVVRERVQEGVEADDVNDEGNLRHHREESQLRRAPRVGPLDLLALECDGRRKVAPRNGMKATQKRGRGGQK